MLLSRVKLSIPQPMPAGGKGTSAVLILLGSDPGTGDESVILTKRTDSVETHKGQVSFPGGFWETHDPHSLATALREAQEEIGTRPEDIEVLGALQPIYTRGSVLIHPWVGKIAMPYPFTPNASEVAKLLFLSLPKLVTEGLTPMDIPVGTYTVKSPGLFVDEELVWGATAKLLEQLRERF